MQSTSQQQYSNIPPKVHNAFGDANCPKLTQSGCQHKKVAKYNVPRNQEIHCDGKDCCDNKCDFDLCLNVLIRTHQTFYIIKGLLKQVNNQK